MSEVTVPVEVLDFLCVDKFLRTMVDARALKSAFELGLVDYLVQCGDCPGDELGKALGVDPAGLDLLLNMLSSNSIVLVDADKIGLHPDFIHALGYRDLLESRLNFSGVTMNDFADLFTALIKDPAGFMGSARLFELFDYRRCFEFSEENYARTRGWMGLTSALTRYEAGVCDAMYDFSQHEKMLDVGGNSGEFVLRICRQHAGLSATVFDLPLVCDIGMEDVLAEPEHARISFIKGDLRTDALPGGFDLISFKSMLHDWPDDQACGFLDKAALALAPGGSLLIFERLPIQLNNVSPDFSLLPILLFFRSYRSAEFYTSRLRALGFERITISEVDLDTRFGMVSARKPAA